MTDLAVVADARAVLAARARSFRWGALFLPPAVRDDAAVVYAFCRLADDLVDEASDPASASEAIGALRAELGGARPPRRLVTAFLDVIDRRGPGLGPALDLLHGVESDVHEVRVADDAALFRYCYEVAGTVGLLMTGVLGVRDPAAQAPALALGRAMQLTNICRDVAADAELGRVYLPLDRLAAAGIDASDVLGRRAAVGPILKDLLRLADDEYARGEAGLRFIPARSRVAIRVASRLYQAIGAEIARRGHDAWSGRAVVSPGRKVVLALGAVLGLP